MKRVVIIDHFSQTPDEPGNNRFLYLAQMLCQKGCRVEIITTDFSHKAKKTRQTDPQLLAELPYGYTMLPEPGYPKNVCLQRFYSHYIHGKHLRTYLQTMEKPDVVYAAMPSLDAAGAAADYCRKNDVPFIVDIQDLWPEAFKLVFHIPVLSDLIFAPMAAMANGIYRQASKIVAVSETYKQRGLKSCKNDKEGLCVYLGTDLCEFDKYADSIPMEKPESELWVAYVGTLGHSYNIEIVIDALNLLPDTLASNVVFKVLGDGPLMERFRVYAKDCKVPVDFLGRLDYPHMAACLKHADIAVNPIVKGAAQSIINKHADYAAAGLPVVSTQECPEYRKLLDRYSCGINCQPDSPQQVADGLEALICDREKRVQMGQCSRRMAQERFDRKYTYEQITARIEELAR